MRRNYISPEFDKVEVYGTYNMLEESNFFGAKMLEIEDSILVADQNLIYYQRANGEQTDYNTETTLDPIIYSSSDSKLGNHNITIDQKQTQYNLENSTKWILDINTGDILYGYLFACLKKYRTFEGMKGDMNVYNDVNTAIGAYIDANVMNRYKFSSVDLYISYTDLRSQNALRYKNVWSIDTYLPGNKFTKFQTVTQLGGSSVRLLFSQEKPSSSYRFSYYFNILFEKI